MSMRVGQEKVNHYRAHSSIGKTVLRSLVRRYRCLSLTEPSCMMKTIYDAETRNDLQLNPLRDEDRNSREIASTRLALWTFCKTISESVSGAIAWLMNTGC